MRNVASLTVGFLMSAGVAAAQDVQPTICDPSYELGPSGVLEEGAGVFVQSPDLRSDGYPSACTAGSWLERHKDFLKDEGRDDALELCTVGEGGLDVGPGPHGNYYYDEEANPEPDKRVLICRDDKGNCYICAPAVS
ncbi:MAG: hypothetical protein GW778_05025 [Alphaproteobacteria bacterium]|nr:hypothetical protein [Alphaproteobacteria bacterium]